MKALQFFLIALLLFGYTHYLHAPESPTSFFITLKNKLWGTSSPQVFSQEQTNQLFSAPLPFTQKIAYLLSKVKDHQKAEKLVIAYVDAAEQAAPEPTNDAQAKQLEERLNYNEKMAAYFLEAAVTLDNIVLEVHKHILRQKHQAAQEKNKPIAFLAEEITTQSKPLISSFITQFDFLIPSPRSVFGVPLQISL